MATKRKTFYKPENVFNQVKKKINVAVLKDERVDYLTFVSD
jgi:hypothetical protein